MSGRVATITRRTALGAMTAAGAAYLALYRPRRDPRERGRVVIDYWEKWTGQEALAMQRQVDLYNDAQDRVFVRYFSVGAIAEKSLVAIAGGSPPDVVGLWDDKIPAFLESGAITPLEELDAEWGAQTERFIAERFGEADVRLRSVRYAAPIWRLMTHDGRVGGAPNTCSSLALYLSMQAMQEAGARGLPRTIDELDALSDAMVVRDGQGRIRRAGFMHSEPGWWKWIWGYFFGGRIYDEATDAAVIASEENLRGYRWMQSYPERYGAWALGQFQSGFGGYNSLEQPILAGKVGMILQGPFVANVFAAFAPEFAYVACPFPVARGLEDESAPVGMIEGDMLCVPRGCRHPKEAFEFIMFTQTQRVADALARAHAKPTPFATASAGFAQGHPNRSIEVHQRIVQSARAFSKPRTRAWPKIEAEFNAHFASMWELRESAEAALEDIDRSAQRHLQREEERREALGR